MNLRFAICDLRMGTTPAPGVVFRALAENYVGEIFRMLWFNRKRRCRTRGASNNDRGRAWSPFLLLIVTIFSLTVSTCAAETYPLVNPSVGMEGRVEITLPGTALDALPLNVKSPLVLRIADTRPHGTLIAYDLRYIGMVPGKYDLRNFLVRKDGSPLDDLPTIPVEVVGILPAKHEGELVSQNEKPIPALGGYKTMLIASGVLWGGALIIFLTLKRKKKATQQTTAITREPTLAERLRPLVEQAAEGKLTRDGQAQLERMLLSHWKQRLGLENVNMAEAVRVLREHPEGGALLRELENWLHRPPGAAKVDVNAVLAPYRNLPVGEQPVATSVK